MMPIVYNVRATTFVLASKQRYLVEGWYLGRSLFASRLCTLLSAIYTSRDGGALLICLNLLYSVARYYRLPKRLECKFTVSGSLGLLIDSLVNPYLAVATAVARRYLP